MKVLHIFRAPVGGLFRHVRDLARGQAELGLEVGAICDSTTGDALAEQKIPQDWLAADPPPDFDDMVGKPREVNPNF